MTDAENLAATGSLSVRRRPSSLAVMAVLVGAEVLFLLARAAWKWTSWTGDESDPGRGVAALLVIYALVVAGGGLGGFLLGHSGRPAGQRLLAVTVAIGLVPVAFYSCIYIRTGGL